MSSAFAGGVASGILGSKTGDFLTWVTIVLVSMFLVLAVVLAKFYTPSATVEFNAGQPARQTQPVEQPAERPFEPPMEEAPSAVPGSADANVPGS